MPAACYSFRRLIVKISPEVRSIATLFSSSPGLVGGVVCLVLFQAACAPQSPSDPTPATWCGAGEGALRGFLAPIGVGIALGPGGGGLALLAPVGAVIGAIEGGNNQACPVPIHATADPVTFAGLSRQDILARLGEPDVVWEEHRVIVYSGPDEAAGMLLIQFDATGRVLRAQRFRPIPVAARTHFDDVIRGWAVGGSDANH